MKDNTRVDFYWVLAALLSGIVGFSVSDNNFEFHKLLNLIGLIYDFLAVLLLSYVILAKDSIQEALAHHISLAIIAFSLLFPAGFYIGALVGVASPIIDGNMYAFIFISLAPTLYIYSSPVLEPLSYKSYSPEKRIKILGAIILLMGFAFQVVASVSDTFLLAKPSI